MVVKKIRENGLFIVTIIFLFIVVSSNYLKVADNDFFHIAVSGRDILADWHNLYENHNFVLEGYKTMIQQWLYAIALWKSYELAGFTGVKIFTAVQLILLLYLAYRYFVLNHIGRSFSVFLAFLVPYTMDVYINCRPQMISVILFLWQFIIMEKYKQGNEKIKYLLPVITLLEVNLHMTFIIFHFIFMLPYFVPISRIPVLRKTGILDDSVPFKPFFLPVVLMGLTCFINPYGYKAYLILLWSGKIVGVNIAEMRMLRVISPHTINLMVLAGTGIWLMSKKRLQATDFYFFIGTFVMCAFASRNIIFVACCSIFLIRTAAAYLEEKHDISSLIAALPKLLGKKISSIATFLTCMVVIGVFFESMFIGTYIGKNDNPLQPAKAVDYIKENDDAQNVKLFTDLSSGSYFLFHGIGRVYMEPKTEPYLEQVNGQKDIISEYGRILSESGSSVEEIEDFLNEYNFDYLYILSMYDTGKLDMYLALSDEYECVLDIRNEECSIYKLYKKKSL